MSFVTFRILTDDNNSNSHKCMYSDRATKMSTFADNTALLHHIRNEMQDNLITSSDRAQQFGLYKRIAER